MFQTLIENIFIRITETKKDPIELIGFISDSKMLTHGLIEHKDELIINFQKVGSFDIQVPGLRAQFGFKRFGLDFGMKVTSMNSKGDAHQEITRLLNGWISEGICHTIRPFVKRYSLVIHGSFATKEYDSEIDLYSMLKKLRRHTPWIDWPMSDATLLTLANELSGQWLEDHKETILGTYKDTTIQGRLLCGSNEESDDPIYRKGVIRDRREKYGSVSFMKIKPIVEHYPRIELTLTASGFSQDDWNNGFTGDSTLDCETNQIDIEKAVNKILIGIGECSN